ncbi:MAG TPA: peptidylprolyl isomerase [Flavipsychrobacter sp.]|nr:peptidylprolyl isomerase [Flavipsychrobacter sp.]
MFRTHHPFTYRIAFLAIVCLTLPHVVRAQLDNMTGTIDKIVAVVGKNRIILKSELETNFAQAKQSDPTLDDSVKSQVLQQLVLQKLLVEQAERDSLLVSDEEVDGNIENKIRYYIRQYGSKEKLEQMTGKTVYQLKDENKDVIREMMMAEKMQGKIMENIKITPAEVKAFYDKVPADSLPFFPATIEIGQIVIDPPVSRELDEYARKKLEDIRNQILTEGKSFETMAGIYSDDPGSRDNGGRYNDVTRTGGWAPEFVSAAFKLQNGEVSPIVKTQFGYHIIQMIQRKGEQVDLRHILIRPEKTSADFDVALRKLDSIRTILTSGKMSFPEAVGKFSTDESAKQNGGMILDPVTAASEIDMQSLDPQMVLILDTLQPGSYSAPQMFQTERGEQSTRIVYLKSRTEPHKANLKDDYSKIQDVALGQKKSMHLQEWVKTRMPNAYIRIAPEYANSSVFNGWNLAKQEGSN